MIENRTTKETDVGFSFLLLLVCIWKSFFISSSFSFWFLFHFHCEWRAIWRRAIFHTLDFFFFFFLLGFCACFWFASGSMVIIMILIQQKNFFLFVSTMHSIRAWFVRLIFFFFLAENSLKTIFCFDRGTKYVTHNAQLWLYFSLLLSCAYFRHKILILIFAKLWNTRNIVNCIRWTVEGLTKYYYICFVIKSQKTFAHLLRTPCRLLIVYARKHPLF